MGIEARKYIPVRFIAAPLAVDTAGAKAMEKV
jgi:hypothetical protein